MLGAEWLSCHEAYAFQISSRPESITDADQFDSLRPLERGGQADAFTRYVNHPTPAPETTTGSQSRRQQKLFEVQERPLDLVGRMGPGW